MKQTVSRSRKNFIQSHHFTTFYVFVGLGIIAGLIGIVGEAVVEDVTQRAEKKKG